MVSVQIPPNGGPADTNVTKVVETAPTNCWPPGLQGVKRISLDAALASGHVKEQDLCSRSSKGWRISSIWPQSETGLTLGVDPLGGSGIETLETHWRALKSMTIVNDQVGSALYLDKDGAIRMDCSSSIDGRPAGTR